MFLKVREGQRGSSLAVLTPVGESKRDTKWQQQQEKCGFTKILTDRKFPLSRIFRGHFRGFRSSTWFGTLFPSNPSLMHHMLYEHPLCVVTCVGFALGNSVPEKGLSKLGENSGARIGQNGETHPRGEGQLLAHGASRFGFLFAREPPLCSLMHNSRHNPAYWELQAEMAFSPSTLPSWRVGRHSFSW